MRSSACALLLVLAACSDQAETTPEPPPGPPEPFTVMSFNVLCSLCGEGMFEGWDARIPYFADIFDRYDADLYALQELSFAPEVEQMKELLPGYEALYYTPAEGVPGIPYPDSTLLYRSERFERIASGFYWLSPTPDEPASAGFASPQLPRLVAWAELRDKRSRRRLYFAGTHFDNNSPSQEKSAPLVLERTEPYLERMPAVVAGDFNSQPEDEAYQTLTTVFSNSFDLAGGHTVASNQTPVPDDFVVDDRIDHIFVSPADFLVDSWTVDLYKYGTPPLYPSDHFAIFARLREAED